MEEGEGLLSFPEEGKSVDFYIQTESEEGESIKSNIVTFTCEDGYYNVAVDCKDGNKEEKNS